MYRSKSFSTLTLISSIALFNSPVANSASKSPPKPSAKSVKSGSSAHPKLLSNPKSTYKILLDSHVQFGGDEGWRKVSILAPDG